MCFLRGVGGAVTRVGERVPATPRKCHPRRTHARPSHSRRRAQVIVQQTIRATTRIRHVPCNRRRQDHDREDTVRTATRTTLALAAVLAMSAVPGRAQTAVSFSMGAGSLFGGVSLGIGVGVHTPGPLFFGTSLGLYRYSPWAASPYGIYSDNYAGWGRGYRGQRAWLASSCWDAYWGWNDPWFGGCGWDSYMSWWTPWWMHGSRYGTSIVVSGYWRDPFSTPWGPYWAYDPWGWYWDSFWGRATRGGWYDGYGGRGWYGGYYGGRGVRVYRPTTGIPRYKESPRSPTGRTAKPRARVSDPATPSRSARPRVSPSRRPTTGRAPVAAPSRRPTTGRAPVAAPARRPTTERAPTAAPARPSDRARRGSGSRGGDGAFPTVRSSARSPSSRSVRPQAQERRSMSRPSDRIMGRSAPSSRSPSARTGTARPSTGRVTPWARRDAPAARSAPTRRSTPAARAPASRSPWVRSAPRAQRSQPRARASTGRSRPAVRSAPSRPAVRSAPARRAPRSQPSGRARPTTRRSGRGGE